LSSNQRSQIARCSPITSLHCGEMLVERQRAKSGGNGNGNGV
jgi:hypothetical protein